MAAKRVPASAGMAVGSPVVAGGLVVAGLTVTWWRPDGDGRSLLAGPMIVLVGLALLVLDDVRLHRDNLTLRRRVADLARENGVLQDELQVVQDFSVTLAEFDDETIRLKAEIEAQNHALADANTRLEMLATTDTLTGLANHRALVDALEREIARAQNASRAFAVLFLDLDYFKALNDTCGHQAGDTALVELANLAIETLGPSAFVGRWGGEEFLGILPESTLQTGHEIAETLRLKVANHAFASSGGGCLTCSIGVALFPRDAQDSDALVAAADGAMYAAKRLGRNQVRMVGDPAVAALDGVAGRTDVREDAALIGTVEALAALVEARDQYTGQHCREVVKLAASAARALGLDDHEVRLVEMAARLQDVGKVAIPDAVLQKDDGPLSEDEWRLLRGHPIVGADVISHIPALRVLAPLIRSHHERWDGQGYPDGLRGESIPFGARIVAVADAYRALTVDRPYHKGRPPIMAVAELKRCVGTQFDAVVVEALAVELARESTRPNAMADDTAPTTTLAVPPPEAWRSSQNAASA